MAAALLLALGVSAAPVFAQPRATIEASQPTALAVTVYRDPGRAPDEQLERDWPQGFAMISETRQVTLPPGESTIRFTGVAEGMVAVSAIVTGLPGGTIEKNRNADLLSPASLVDGTLGNRVRITRTNPGTGAEESESAIIRTRADGGLVLQTDDGFEAVRCSGLPERLSFDRVPEGLSAEPVFTLDTRDEAGGTFEVVLTYLAWGFDWQANYVATLREGGSGERLVLDLMSWLTILNDNGQSFENAELLAVAGTIEVVSDFQGLASPPQGRPLMLTCYPLGSSMDGSGADYYGEGMISPSAPPPPPPAPAMMRAMDAQEITVTATRRLAQEEDLGELKLYRVPEPVDVAAKGLKQVAFLDRDAVRGRFLYLAECTGHVTQEQPESAAVLFVTKNDEAHGLGVALPTGPIAFFEPTRAGDLLVGEQVLRDYAKGQDLELNLGSSSQVFAQCRPEDAERKDRRNGWNGRQLVVTNANATPAHVRLVLGPSGAWDYRGLRTQLKDGQRVAEITVPANSRRVFAWSVRDAPGRGGP